MARSTLLLIALIPLFFAGCGRQNSATIKTDDQKISYGIGLNLGKSMKQQGLEVDAQAVAAGIADAQSGAKPKVAINEIESLMLAKQQQLMKDRLKADAAAASKNAADGEAFLKENEKKAGVKTTASGLQYKVEKEGKGKKPSATSTVTVNYRGTLIDGKEFDSSYKRNEPATFPVNGVIPGWTEGLQLMTEGSKYQFFIPAKLAYGEQGAGNGVIPPGATLVFEVELLKID
ncbi:MAG: FKBP-type peptidyl-prolyl cis-trans isomerase [Verrucomicrobium sp.]|nr:FKBP-type peptidyl-prolyl cis-trans isomerase [Verrucomicrobium sp.]